MPVGLSGKRLFPVELRHNVNRLGTRVVPTVRVRWRGVVCVGTVAISIVSGIMLQCRGEVIVVTPMRRRRSRMVTIIVVVVRRG